MRDFIRELHFEVVIITHKSKRLSSSINGAHIITANSEEGVQDILINYVKGFGASVITNEKFEELRKIDKWVSDNIDKYIINYSISENDTILINKKEILKLHLMKMIRK